MPQYFPHQSHHERDEDSYRYKKGVPIQNDAAWMTTLRVRVILTPNNVAEKRGDVKRQTRRSANTNINIKIAMTSRDKNVTRKSRQRRLSLPNQSEWKVTCRPMKATCRATDPTYQHGVTLINPPIQDRLQSIQWPSSIPRTKVIRGAGGS